MGGLGVVIGGDTLITTTQPYDRDVAHAASTGVTSQNQFYCPSIDHRYGYLKTYSESACKIGRLNDYALVAACGDRALIKAILKFYFDSPASIRSYSNFFPRFTDDLCLSLSPLEFDENTTAEFIFAIYNNGLVTFIDMRYVVDENYSLRHHGKYWFPNAIRPAYFKGSGHPFFIDFSGSFHFNIDGLSETDTIQQATAIEVSNHISKKTNSDARTGIGGAILTYYLGNKGVHPPEDTIYIYANKDGEVSVLSKVCFRDGYFYLVDYIERKLTGFAPLELQVKGIQTKTNDYVQEIVKDVSQFDAKWLFLTREIDTDTDKKFEVILQGSQASPLFAGDNIQDLIFKDLKNGRLNLTFENNGGNRVFNFKIRS